MKSVLKKVHSKSTNETSPNNSELFMSDKDLKKKQKTSQALKIDYDIKRIKEPYLEKDKEDKEDKEIEDWNQDLEKLGNIFEDGRFRSIYPRLNYPLSERTKINKAKKKNCLNDSITSIDA